jgi:hypothetical protein
MPGSGTAEMRLRGRDGTDPSTGVAIAVDLTSHLAVEVNAMSFAEGLRPGLGISASTMTSDGRIRYALTPGFYRSTEDSADHCFSLAMTASLPANETAYMMLGAQFVSDASGEDLCALMGVGWRY